MNDPVALEQSTGSKGDHCGFDDRMHLFIGQAIARPIGSITRTTNTPILFPTA